MPTEIFRKAIENINRELQTHERGHRIPQDVRWHVENPNCIQTTFFNAGPPRNAYFLRIEIAPTASANTYRAEYIYQLKHDAETNPENYVLKGQVSVILQSNPAPA